MHADDERVAALESRLEEALGRLDALGDKERALAALEQRLEAAKAAIGALERRLAEKDEAYDELLAALERREGATAAPSEGPYVVFALLRGGYELVEAEGRIPQPGERLELGGTTHVVLRVGRAPGADRPTVHTTPA